MIKEELKMKIDKKVNNKNIKLFKKIGVNNGGPINGKILLFAGYGKEWALIEERLHENCIINFYDISSHN